MVYQRILLRGWREADRDDLSTKHLGIPLVFQFPPCRLFYSGFPLFGFHVCGG